MIQYEDNSICFEEKDLEKFRRQSGDNNPLHIDKIFAETTVYGEQVIFGMLGVEALLGLCYVSGSRLDIKFNSPLFLNRRYYYARKSKGDVVILHLLEHHSVLLEIKVSDSELKRTATMPGAECTAVPMLERARSLTDCEIEEAKTITGVYTVSLLQQVWGGDKTSPLCQVQRLLSYLVGMVAPGERALFMKASTYLLDDPPAADTWEYRMSQLDYHDVLGMVDYQVEVFALGKLIAVCKIQSYVRADFNMFRQPLQQISQEHTGRTVLILGGTKGLGAQIAMYYAQRGASIVLTYQRSKEHARQFCDYLSTVSGHIECVQSDASSLVKCQELKAHMEESYGGIDRLYICAAQSPRKIEMHPDNYPLFEKYLTQGVQMFYYPFFVLKESVRANGKITILSTIATVERLFFHNIPEYICVKSAVESISECAFYKEREGRQYFVARPPKMLTEMNNTPVGRVGSERPEDMAVKLIRAVEEEPEQGKIFRFLEFYPSQIENAP